MGVSAFTSAFASAFAAFAGLLPYLILQAVSLQARSGRFESFSMLNIPLFE